MPHIIIEHSQNAFNPLELNAVLNDVAMAISNTKLFSPQNIKVRLHPAEHFLLDASLSGFIHVQCRIHKGRSSNQKKAVSESVLNSLTTYSKNATVITVEIVDMEQASYTKKIIT
jgi:5-carboxymethyl-2-hydroxymuconate isomerase